MSLLNFTNGDSVTFYLLIVGEVFSKEGNNLDSVSDDNPGSSVILF